MQSYWPYSDARCAFCRKLLPVNDGQVLAWRSANGLFFCTEFCAGDAEEAPRPIGSPDAGIIAPAVSALCM
jgi:hypothetical protein